MRVLTESSQQNGPRSQAAGSYGFPISTTSLISPVHTGRSSVSRWGSESRGAMPTALDLPAPRPGLGGVAAYSSSLGIRLLFSSVASFFLRIKRTALWVNLFFFFGQRLRGAGTRRKGWMRSGRKKYREIKNGVVISATQYLQ